jgi:hypothetical protein
MTTPSRRSNPGSQCLPVVQHALASGTSPLPRAPLLLARTAHDRDAGALTSSPRSAPCGTAAERAWARPAGLDVPPPRVRRAGDAGALHSPAAGLLPAPRHGRVNRPGGPARRRGSEGLWAARGSCSARPALCATLRLRARSGRGVVVHLPLRHAMGWCRHEGIKHLRIDGLEVQVPLRLWQVNPCLAEGAVDQDVHLAADRAPEVDGGPEPEDKVQGATEAAMTSPKSTPSPTRTWMAPSPMIQSMTRVYQAVMGSTRAKAPSIKNTNTPTPHTVNPWATRWGSAAACGPRVASACTRGDRKLSTVAARSMRTTPHTRMAA